MTTGKTFALIGALAAFPRRLAAREVERQGGELQHGITRRTSHVVFGRTLLDKVGEAKLEARFLSARGAARILYFSCLDEAGDLYQLKFDGADFLWTLEIVQLAAEPRGRDAP